MVLTGTMMLENAAHHPYDTKLKNLMERFIQQIKDRTQSLLMIIILVEERRIVIGSIIYVWNWLLKLYFYCVFAYGCT
jgi:hypothetical protein